MAEFINGGQAIIEGDAIVIRVPVSGLSLILDGAWATNKWDTRYKVTNAATFAKEIMHTLNAEDEQGTTAIHRMFDEAMISAIGDGAEGIDEHEEQQI